MSALDRFNEPNPAADATALLTKVGHTGSKHPAARAV